MEDFINSSKSGFVYIAFGTVADFSTFDELVKEEFINALTHFPNIKFVWASSNEVNGTLPSNVFVSKWVPQQTVLGMNVVFAILLLEFLYFLHEIFITHTHMHHNLHFKYLKNIFQLLNKTAHPKIKAFITHSGMGSTTESILHSVPLICIPVLAEQDLNANAVVSRGAGIKLEITTLREHQLQNAISEVLTNPKYYYKAFHTIQN